MTNLKDIAQAAGVSAITVSRVMNDSGKVKPVTRARINKIMRDTGYTPNMAAKNLMAKRTGVIDIYIPEMLDLSDPFMMHFILGVSEALSGHLYSFLIKRSWATEHRCDGYIVTGLLTGEIADFYAKARAQDLPAVLFGHTDIAEVDFYDVDSAAGGELAVRYLLENGHRRIAMINSDERKDYAIDRYSGYVRSLAAAGIKLNPALVVCAPPSADGGKAAAKELFDRSGGGGFTAIFCATDALAIGAINAINERGLRVPEDISVVGFDGLGRQFLAGTLLTTIAQPVIEMGKALANTLVCRIRGDTARTAGFMAPTLLLGKSVRKI
ncbi:MAG: substrate-binding domain-containing protein [Treponemataceae bacterium]|nr:MAG: substrate-binding domain-containing protein [Treponemataceae bacterium]